MILRYINFRYLSIYLSLEWTTKAAMILYFIQFIYFLFYIQFYNQGKDRYNGYVELYHHIVLTMIFKMVSFLHL